MNKDESTMKALADETRRLFRESNDARRLFGDYFGDMIESHIRPLLEEKDERIEDLEEEVKELKDELNDIDR